MEIKVSVIVPVYNVEKYLPKCLDSIINQTLKDIEIIVVNDESPDNSEEIIKKYLKKDKRIVYLKKENGGLGSSRNKGMEHAKGEYLYFVDSDDWIDNDTLEKMYYEALNNDLDIVICGYKKIYDNKEELITTPPYLIKETLNNQNSKIFNIISACCKLYKKSFLDKENIKFTSEKIWYEDLPFSLKILSQTSKIGFVNLPLYNYIIRENSIMNNDNINKNLDILKAFDDVINFYLDKNIYDKYQKEIEYLAIDNIVISGITRIIRSNADKKNKNEVIDNFLNYMKDNFPNYKNNNYLKTLSRNRKIIYRLISLKQYWLIRLIFKVK